MRCDEDFADIRVNQPCTAGFTQIVAAVRMTPPQNAEKPTRAGVSHPMTSSTTMLNTSSERNRTTHVFMRTTLPRGGRHRHSPPTESTNDGCRGIHRAELPAVAG